MKHVWMSVFVVSWITSQQPVACVKEPADVMCVKIIGTQEQYDTEKEAQDVAVMLKKMQFQNVTIQEKKEQKK